MYSTLVTNMYEANSETVSSVYKQFRGINDWLAPSGLTNPRLKRSQETIVASALQRINAMILVSDGTRFLVFSRRTTGIFVGVALAIRHRAYGK